jgi:hypothetical protein
MSWASAAHSAYQVYQGVKLALAVIDMATTLYEISITVGVLIRKKML